MTGSPYTGPEYAMLHLASMLRSTRVNVRSPMTSNLPFPVLRRLGLERQQGVIGRVRNVAGRQVTLRTESVPPVLIRWIDTKIEGRVVQVVCVQLHLPGHASDTSVH